MKKNSDIAPEDVTNMKFDPPLTELECFTGISARALRERERNASEEEQNLRENISSSPALEKTTLKQPLGSAMGKKNVVLPRDITKEDVQDLKGTLFSSEFDVLVEIARRARKLYKEEEQKLKLSQSEQGETEEEPFSDDNIPIFDPSPPETCNAQKSWIKKPDLTVDDCKGLEFGPHIPPIHALFQVSCRGKELLIDEEVSMKKASVEEGKEKLILSARREEDFHCPMPEAVAKRQRMLMMEKNLKKPLVTENPKRGYVNKRKWYERVDNEIEEEEEKEDDHEEEEEEEEWASRVIKKKKTSNNKGSKKRVNGNYLDNYMPDLPEEFMDKIRGENGWDVKLVIQKQLTKTDLESGQNRLLMPVNQLNRHDFLTENEQQLLLERTLDGRRLKGIGVLFIEPNGDRNLGGLVFKRWVMPKDTGRNSSTVYVFNGKWHDLCKKHKLNDKMIVQVYSFRYDKGNLGFAMVIVENGNRKGKGNDNIGSGSGSGSQKLRKIGCSVW